ncbi:hypothetical protein [Streptomyces sp. T028]|uniref:hypothetical protein n=1 Tax=Streptomyces sp. T028 TaxID=3394379 RepID=UPI003A86BCB9
MRPYAVDSPGAVISRRYGGSSRAPSSTTADSAAIGDRPRAVDVPAVLRAATVAALPAVCCNPSKGFGRPFRPAERGAGAVKDGRGDRSRGLPWRSWPA